MDTVHGMESRAGFIVFGNSIRGERVRDADGRGVFIFNQGYEEVVRVWEDRRGADRWEGKVVVHLDGEGLGG